jgi:WD repeat-containing protein 19
MRQLFRLDAGRGSRDAAAFAWEPRGNYLAAGGEPGLVHIYDRHGDHVAEISGETTAPVKALAWDRDGDCLAIMQDREPTISLWDSQMKTVTKLDTALKDPSFFCWSRTSSQLVVGNKNGNILVYDRRTRKKVSVLGKHPKKITCGCWSAQTNKLALGSDDRTLTLSNESGDTLEQTELKHAPVDMQFATQKRDASDESETHLSINMGGKSLLLYDLKEPDNPLELAFSSKYGSIVAHTWFGDGLMLLGFSDGYVVVISTSMREIGQEQYSGQFHKKRLDSIAYSPALNYAAVAGDGGIKLVDLSTFKDMKKETVTDLDGSIAKVEWSPDGHVLCASTKRGQVATYLARMPLVHGACGDTVAYLSSLREITLVKSGTPEDDQNVVIPVGLEPSYLAVGPKHVGVGMNNAALFYDISTKEEVHKEEYNGRVSQMSISESHCAVLSGGRVTLHAIDGSRRRTFPDRDSGDEDDKVTALALTKDVLVYGTKTGTVHFFAINPEGPLPGVELRHERAILKIVPNAQGTRFIVVDTSKNAYVYAPTTSDLTPIPSFPRDFTAVIWEVIDRHVFIVSSPSELHTYAYAPQTVRGAVVAKLGAVDVSETGGVTMRPKASPLHPQGLVPVCSHDGTITCQTSGGTLTKIQCPLYEHRDDDDATPELHFCQNLALLRLKDAWNAAIDINKRPYWLALSGKAMDVLDVNMAIRVYRQLGDAGMVLGLERIKPFEDTNLLAGHILLLFQDYDAAQDLFLASTQPLHALDMRRDLLHWEQALKLAHSLDPSQVPAISCSYAQQLEFKGEYDPALRAFESAKKAIDRAYQRRVEEKEEDLEGDMMRKKCLCGVARCTLHLGDLRKGMTYLREADDKILYRDCAHILEGMNQHSEAAGLYEDAEHWEKAAAIYIKKLDFSRCASVMPKVTLPKLHAQYAKACEASDRFQEAVEAYENAHDLDSVVRLHLNQLNTPERGFDIVRRTQSSDGARLVAKFCQDHGDFKGAIEFLLMAKGTEEAFELAKLHNQVEKYTEVLGDSIRADDALNVAQHYEKINEPGLAGKYYALCNDYGRALELFIKCGEKEVHAAIDIVGKARNDALTHTLIDFLMGEPDGVPKDPNYIYRLYIALGNYPQAAKTAVIIAKQEQELGNYAQAHAILHETIVKLREQKVHVPQALRHPFVLLHSYVLAGKLARRGEQDLAARMLLRVAKSISKFPAHVVPILTSVVVACTKAGLKQSAHEYALQLMKPEYRSKIDAKFKRKIEAIIRKAQDLDEIAEPTSKCPVSSQQIPITSLECPTTQEELPMCVVTGRHVEKEDFCVCPNSRMPALRSHYLQYIKTEGAAARTRAIANEAKGGEPVKGQLEVLDPVCGKPVMASELTLMAPEEVDAFLKEWAK